jgi:hypothetical protein
VAKRSIINLNNWDKRLTTLSTLERINSPQGRQFIILPAELVHRFSQGKTMKKKE